MQLFDAHAHLEEIRDLVGALERAARAGVTAVVAVGSDLESNRAVLDIAGRHDGVTVHPSLGIHPCRLERELLEPSLDFVAAHVGRSVAVGETGLDAWLRSVRKDSRLLERQREVFGRLLVIARENDRPVIVHSRGAWRECLDMVLREGVRRALFHWYSGPADVLDGILEAGHLISATPAAAASEHHRRALSRAPLERILVETDAPTRFGEKASEPADVALAVEALAGLKELTAGEVAAATSENARRFFGLPSSVP